MKIKVRLTSVYEVEFDESIVTPEALERAAAIAQEESDDYFDPEYDAAAMFIGMKINDSETDDVEDAFGDAIDGISWSQTTSLCEVLGPSTVDHN
jgi:hypothetical protein